MVEVRNIREDRPFGESRFVNGPRGTGLMEAKTGGS